MTYKVNSLYPRAFHAMFIFLFVGYSGTVVTLLNFVSVGSVDPVFMIGVVLALMFGVSGLYMLTVDFCSGYYRSYGFLKFVFLDIFAMSLGFYILNILYVIHIYLFIKFSIKIYKMCFSDA